MNQDMLYIIPNYQIKDMYKCHILRLTQVQLYIKEYYDESIYLIYQ